MKPGYLCLKIVKQNHLKFPLVKFELKTTKNVTTFEEIFLKLKGYIFINSMSTCFSKLIVFMNNISNKKASKFSVEVHGGDF